MSSAPHLERPTHETSAAMTARVARLYEKHARMVYGICRAILRDGHEAEDATQQTFLLAHRALLGGAHVRNDAAWLATIARNESRTRIVASMRSPLPISDEDLASIPTTGDEIERGEQLEAIRSALADLPERQREAVVLRDIYGLRYGEVATALGLSRPATDALLFRARRAMRHRLKPVVTTVLVVPISIQEGLAQAIPGFASAGSGGVAAGVAGGGLLAKLTAGPVGVKVATATVAVTTVGTVGSVESERAGRDRADRAAIVAVEEDRSGSSHADRSGPSSGDDDERDGDDSSGHGNGEDRGEDNSGPGSHDDDRSGPGGGTEDSHNAREDRSGSDSSSSGSSSGDDPDSSGSSSKAGSSRSGSSGSGSGEPVDGSSEPSDSSGPSSSSGQSSRGDSSGSGSGGSNSGSGSSGSESGGSDSGSGSSGSGSPAEEPEASND